MKKPLPRVAGEALKTKTASGYSLTTGSPARALAISLSG